MPEEKKNTERKTQKKKNIINGSNNKSFLIEKKKVFPERGFFHQTQPSIKIGNLYFWTFFSCVKERFDFNKSIHGNV